MIIPKEPFHTVETDCMLFSQNEADLRANSGYYILSTYTDQFSKWSYAVWLKNQTMKETIRAMKKFLAAIPDGKKPKFLLSDQGTEYGRGSKKSEFSQFISS